MSPVPALEQALVALRCTPGAVVLVDGRSGTGKSTFAAALAARGRATLLRLDDVYPGWDGLEAASESLVPQVLLPRRRGVPGTIRRWDWGQGVPSGPLPVDVGRPLVVEGCGALTAASARFAALSVWFELPGPERRRRALDRDGDAYAPHWERWARQERLAIARARPRALADLVVDGSTFPPSLLSASTGGVQ